MARSPLRVVLAIGAALAAASGGAASPAPVVLLAGGDVMPVQAAASVIASRGPDHPFTALAPLLRGGDVVFVNLEAPLTTRGAPTPGKSRDDLAAGRDYLFRGSPVVAAALRRAGVTIVSLANNHAMDYGPVGLLDTIAHVERAGIRVVGAGATLAAARAPVVLTVRGVRIAFLARSDVIPRRSVAGPRSPGVAPARGWWTGRAAEDEIVADVRAARARADHVIVSMHWGEQSRTVPSCRQAGLAARMIRAGAAVVLGHHPHVLQPVVQRGRHLVAYSLGNLVASPGQSLARESALLRVSLGPGGVLAWDATPLLLSVGHTRVAGEPSATAIHRRLRAAPTCRRDTAPATRRN